MVHKPAFDALPGDLQTLVAACCRAVNEAMLAEYTARNQQALEQLTGEHGVQFLPLPKDVLGALRHATRGVLEEAAARDPFTRRVYDSVLAFEAQARAWHRVSEEAYYAARAGWAVRRLRLRRAEGAGRAPGRTLRASQQQGARDDDHDPM